jgi:hypothetical protein
VGLDRAGETVFVEHEETCVNGRFEQAGNTIGHREYNCDKFSHAQVMKQREDTTCITREAAAAGHSPDAIDVHLIHAMSMILQKLADEGGSKSLRMKAGDLIKALMIHMQGVYVEVEKTIGSGPRCDVMFEAEKDLGDTGLICGECHSQTEVVMDQRCRVCSSLEMGDRDLEDTVVKCTRPECGGRTLTACRTCCMETFGATHFFANVYDSPLNHL